MNDNTFNLITDNVFLPQDDTFTAFLNTSDGNKNIM